MSIELFDEALTGRAVSAEYDDGSRELLDVARWVGGVDAADLALLDLMHGPTLDIGCGPGRLTAALTARGIDALGLDIAPGAVRMARDRGADVLHGSVFHPIPREGEWAHALLADGNVGIGGDPQRLLRRVRDLLRPGGQAHVEVGGHGARHGVVRARLRGRDGTSGSWFPWAHVSVGGLEPLAEAAGLSLVRVWEVGGRCFADLSS
jgi:SAM-dependent methyltransferase